MNPDEREQEWREEAERLALLPLQTQIDLIGMYRQKARNPKVPAADRKEAGKRAKALAKLLGLDHGSK